MATKSYFQIISEDEDRKKYPFLYELREWLSEKGFHEGNPTSKLSKKLDIRFYRKNVVVIYEGTVVRVYHFDYKENPTPIKRSQKKLLTNHQTKSTITNIRNEQTFPILTKNDFHVIRLHIENMMMFSKEGDILPVVELVEKENEKPLLKIFEKKKTIIGYFIFMLVIFILGVFFIQTINKPSKTSLTFETAEEVLTISSNIPNTPKDDTYTNDISYIDSSCEGSGIAYMMCVKQAIQSACGQYLGSHMSNGKHVNWGKKEDTAGLKRCVNANVSSANRSVSPY